MYPRKRKTHDKLTLEGATRIGFGTPLFFINADSFDYSAGVCTDLVTGDAGEIVGSVTPAHGQGQGSAALFNDGHVDFGYRDYFPSQTSQILVCARVLRTPGFANNTRLISQDNGTADTRLWSFGWDSIGRQAAGLMTSQVSTGDSPYFYDLSLANATSYEIQGSWVTYCIAAMSLVGEDKRIRLLGNQTAVTQVVGYDLRLQSIANTKLLVGASLQSNGTRNNPFYGKLMWLGVWDYRATGPSELYGFRQKHSSSVGRRHSNLTILPPLVGKTFYVDRNWSHNGKHLVYPALHASPPDQSNLSLGGKAWVRNGNAEWNYFPGELAEVVHDTFTPNYMDFTTTTFGYSAAPYAGGYSGLSVSWQYRRDAAGKIFREVSGDSPAYPARSLGFVADRVRPGDTVLISRDHAMGSTGANDAEERGSDNLSIPGNGGAWSDAATYPPVNIGVYDPETGLQVVSADIRILGTTYQPALTNACFSIQGIANCIGWETTDAKTYMWRTGVIAAGSRTTRSSGVWYGVYQQTPPPYLVYTVGSYPERLSYNNISSYRRGIHAISSYIRLSMYSLDTTGVPTGAFNSCVEYRHSVFSSVMGSGTDLTVMNDEAPGGATVNFYGCDLGPCTALSNSATNHGNESKTYGLYVVRSVSVDPRYSLYNMGRSRHRVRNSTLAYPLSMVGRAADEYLHSVQIDYLYGGGTNPRDPNRAHAYMEWKFFWDGLKDDVQIVCEFLAAYSTKEVTLGPLGAFMSMAVYYTDTSGEYQIHRDDVLEQHATLRPKDYVLEETAIEDRWYRQPGSTPANPVSWSGKRTLSLLGVGRGFVTVRLYPFPYGALGFLYISPVIEVT